MMIKMKKTKNKMIAATLMSSLLLSPMASSYMALAAGADLIPHESSVDSAMCSSLYWYGKTGVSSDTLLMTKEQIVKKNQEMLHAPAANMYDLFQMESNYDAKKLKESLAKAKADEDTKYYCKGNQLDMEAYLNAINEAILTTGYEEENRQIQYAVSVAEANIKSIPTDDIIGYSANDTDDEFQSSSMVVNEAFIIKQRCELQGEVFYYGCTDNCAGWVNAKDLAICRSYQEWFDACYASVYEKNFIVVTEGQITLEASMFDTSISKVELPMGTILKLIPQSEIPANINERATWHNYNVYLPTRNAEGYYEKKMAQISQHYNVSVGYLPYTQKNLLDLSFECLGDRYGWGGMLNAMDCSAYTKNVNRCFGLKIPRNTSWQKEIPGLAIDLSQKTSEEKLQLFQTLPAGTMLYMPGHTMIYVGMDKDMGYVINDCGSLVDSVKDSGVIKVNSVILNSLSVRRGNGTTWLENLTTAVVPGTNLVTVSVKKDCYKYTGKKLTPKVTVTDICGNKLDSSCYTVKYKNNKKVGTATITVKMKNGYTGTKELHFDIVRK